MSDQENEKYLFDDPKNVQRLLTGFYIICALLFAADFVVPRHIYTDLEKIPKFYSFYGFLSFVLLVVLSLGLRKLVMRRENYYDK